ncbi:MAG: hypothetical protein ACYC9R_06290 [Nitrosotalea sp.]
MNEPISYEEFKVLLQKAMAYTPPGYSLRIAIASDAFGQAWFNWGTLGLTISSRASTARLHGHLWGKILCWYLDKYPPFGIDTQTGLPHSKVCIINDRNRAMKVLMELNDPLVKAYLGET